MGRLRLTTALANSISTRVNFMSAMLLRCEEIGSISFDVALVPFPFAGDCVPFGPEGGGDFLVDVALRLVAIEVDDQPFTRTTSIVFDAVNVSAARLHDIRRVLRTNPSPS